MQTRGRELGDQLIVLWPNVVNQFLSCEEAQR